MRYRRRHQIEKRRRARLLDKLQQINAADMFDMIIRETWGWNKRFRQVQRLRAARRGNINLGVGSCSGTS